jgi:phosphocarrier protein
MVGFTCLRPHNLFSGSRKGCFVLNCPEDEFIDKQVGTKHFFRGPQVWPLMRATPESLRRDVTILNDLGLHARAAAKLAKAAQKAQNDVWLEFASERVDAKQVIDIMTLAAAKGDQVTVAIEQAADLDTLNSIVQLFAGGFGE